MLRHFSTGHVAIVLLASHFEELVCLQGTNTKANIIGSPFFGELAGSNQPQHTLTASFALAPLSSTLTSLTDHLISISWTQSRSDVMLIESSKWRAANKTNDSCIQLFEEACGKLLLVCNTSSEPIRLQIQDFTG